MKNELQFRNYSLLDFSHRTYEKKYLLNEFSNLVRMIFDIYIFDEKKILKWLEEIPDHDLSFSR